MLTLEHITKKYDDYAALSDVSLTFPDKGLVIVCGESGCGKTTLLNIASGADLPSFGKVFWCGCELTASNIEQFRRGKVSDVYQDFMLVDEMSCAENIRLAAEACGKSLSDQDVLTLLSRVGLKDEHFSKRVSLLSGGEKQRVAVARALVKDGAIIFADEPSATTNASTESTVNTPLSSRTAASSLPIFPNSPPRRTNNKNRLGQTNLVWRRKAHSNWSGRALKRIGSNASLRR